MRTKTNKIIKSFFCGCALILLSYFLNGCASVPVKETLPIYSINGVSYIPLVSLCNSRGIDMEYDTFTRAITLNRDAHKINLMVGDALVLVDGTPVHLRHPVDIYQDMLVVPYRFKEEVVDDLFKGSYAPRKATPYLSRIKKIVIDAGHGGRDPGAMGRTGLREKDVVLDITKRLSRLLKSAGIEVVMTRSTDKFIDLSVRTDIANNSRANLFLSIHANANRVRSLKGFEVYYVSGSVNDSKRALEAAKGMALNLDSSYFASNSLDLKATLWDMIYTDSRAESIQLARYICKSVSRNLDSKILGIKGARFSVLKGTNMPAILIEVGFLSNSSEEAMLKNSYFREQIADSIAQGVDGYARDFIYAEGGRD